MANRSSSKQNKKSKVSHKLSMIAIAVVVLVLLVALSVKTKTLTARGDEYAARVAALEAEIEAEQARSEALDERAVYVTTKQYVEEVARDRLGLVYPDEIMLIPTAGR